LHVNKFLPTNQTKDDESVALIPEESVLSLRRRITVK